MSVKEFVKKELSQYFNWGMSKPWIRKSTLASVFAYYSGDNELKYKALALSACVIPIPGVFFVGVGAIIIFAAKDSVEYIAEKFKDKTNLNHEYFRAVNARYSKAKENAIKMPVPETIKLEKTA